MDYEKPQTEDLETKKEQPIEGKEKHSESEIGELLESIEHSKWWREKIAEGFWSNLSDKDKTRLYKDGAISFTNLVLKRGNPVFSMIGRFGYESNKLKAVGTEIAPACRTLIQFGLLEKPEGFTDKDLEKGIEKDEKGLKMVLLAIKAILLVFAPEALPEVSALSGRIEQIYGIKTEIAEERQKNVVSVAEKEEGEEMKEAA